MNYSRISLFTKSGIPLSVGNTFECPFEVEAAVEQAKDSKDLEKRLFKTDHYAKSITLDGENENYIRYRIICHMCDNVEYLKVYKN